MTGTHLQEINGDMNQQVIAFISMHMIMKPRTPKTDRQTMRRTDIHLAQNFLAEATKVGRRQNIL